MPTQQYSSSVWTQILEGLYSSYTTSIHPFQDVYFRPTETTSEGNNVRDIRDAFKGDRVSIRQRRLPF